MPFLPTLTVRDREDARLLFDLVNAAFVAETDPDKRFRMADLLIALHTEMTRENDND